MENKSQLKRRIKIKFFHALISFLVLVIVFNSILFAIFYVIEENKNSIILEELKVQQLNGIEISADLLVDEFDYIISDMDFLVNRYEEFVENGNLENPEVIHGWELFSDARKIYDQIRFIDRSGKETIRVNYGFEGAYSVSKYALQNKSGRYYFTDSINLEKGQVFVSKMDLNIENGSIEIPNKPMVRFAAPVYSSDFESSGIIVLNYLAKGILEKFQRLPKPDREKHYLLDSNGYWLSSDNPMEEWTFMYENKQDISFKSRFPDVWEQMDGLSGIIITDDGMFAYARLMIGDTFIMNEQMIQQDNVILDEGQWIAVSYTPIDGPNGYLLVSDFWDTTRIIYDENKISFLVLTLVSLLTAILIYINMVSRERIKFYSTYDVLTGAYNRRAGLEMLTVRMPKDSRRKCGVCFIFLDVNGLKQVNDTLGHDKGDELIVTAANVIMNTIREEDLLIRMGGDEFLIVLKQTFESDAEVIWQRIVKKYQDINDLESRPYFISVSHGIVAADNCRLKGVDEMIKIADELMYKEKREMKVGLDVIRKDV